MRTRRAEFCADATRGGRRLREASTGRGEQHGKSGKYLGYHLAVLASLAFLRDTVGWRNTSEVVCQRGTMHTSTDFEVSEIVFIFNIFTKNDKH